MLSGTGCVLSISPIRTPITLTERSCISAASRHDRMKIKRGQDPRHPGTEIVYISSLDPEEKTE